MRDDQADGPTGEVVVECAKRLPRPHAALAIELSETLFGLGIHGEYGVSRVEVLCLQGGDALKLSLAIGRLTAGHVLGDLVQRQPLFGQPITHHVRTDRRPHLGDLLGNLGRRELGPHALFLVGIAGGADLQHGLQIPFELRLGRDFFFRPPPTRRTRPAAGSSGSWSSSIAPRSIVRVEHPSTAATSAVPPRPSCRASNAAYRRRSFSDNVL